MKTGQATCIGWAVATALSCVLAGCQAMDAQTARYDAPGVPVALDSIEGAPEAVKTRVSAEVATQASARRIEMVETQAKPRYRLKGYVTAYPSDAGDTTLAVVWDVFDASNKRAQRVTTTTIAKGQGEDPWSRIGESQITKATAQSMNQVAAFLAGAPPAGAALPGAGPIATAETGAALGYAPAP